MIVPPNPKIYHIVHVDRLPSIIEDGQLWCDAEMVQRGGTGTAIGMDKIKQRRLTKTLSSHPNLQVGNCVPFYFCPRSVMLYVIYKANDPEISYRGGQDSIVHLEADLRQTVAWAEENGLRWAFTLSNASSGYFEDRCNLAQLSEINWRAVQAEVWRQDKEAKQAEFLIEQRFPWKLVSRIGVQSKQVYYQASVARKAAIHKPLVEIKPEWYYRLQRRTAMIEYKTGDILSEEAEALVNTVNCVGVMGRGIALQFKRAFPENFKAYTDRCKRNEMKPGCMFIFETGKMFPPRYIINFPTKRHWRGKSRIEDIESGLVSLKKEIQSRGIRSIAIPALGCDLGGLNWPDVRARMQEALEELDDVKIILFEPGGGPVDSRANRSSNVPQMTPGRAALVGLMNCYLRSLMNPFVTLLEVHKLMYFMQVAGEPLRLKFVKATYGPYAENLRHVLNAIEGHLVSGYADGGDDPDKELELVPGALEDAQAFLENTPETQARFERVSELIEGCEPSFGLELLSMVHWIASEEKILDFDDIVNHTYAWSERKKQFLQRQIKIAFDVLSEKGWIEHSNVGETAHPGRTSQKNK